MEVPQNGWFLTDNPMKIKMMTRGTPLLRTPYFSPTTCTLEAIGSNAASTVCGAAADAQGWCWARRLLAQLAEDGLRATAVSCWVG